MRKITKEACQAFTCNDTLKKANTEVTTNNAHETVLKLHGNTIAKKSKGLKISNCGYKTNTTKERLNGLLEYCNAGYIYQKNWVWYYVNSQGYEIEMPYDKFIEAH